MILIDKQISPEAGLKIVIEGGQVKFVAALDTKGLDLNLSAGLDSDYFIDELAKAIPGTIDDAIFLVLKGALKAL